MTLHILGGPMMPHTLVQRRDERGEGGTAGAGASRPGAAEAATSSAGGHGAARHSAVKRYYFTRGAGNCEYTPKSVFTISVFTIHFPTLHLSFHKQKLRLYCIHRR